MFLNLKQNLHLSRNERATFQPNKVIEGNKLFLEYKGMEIEHPFKLQNNSSETQIRNNSLLSCGRRDTGLTSVNAVKR